MKDKDFLQTDAHECSPAQQIQQTRHLSAQAQLWALLNNRHQQWLVASYLRHLKKATQEDLCIALVAKLRLGIVRPFADPWKRLHLDTLLHLVDNAAGNDTLNNNNNNHSL